MRFLRKNGSTILVGILLLIIAGGLIWYLNKSYLQPSQSKSETGYSSYLPSKTTEEISDSLVYINLGNVKEIWQEDSNKESKKLFTDADETEKVLKFSNLANFSKSIFIITSKDTSAFSGKLVSLNLDTLKQEVLQEVFTVPESWGISTDAKQFVFVRFSNIEENYGYTLYSQASSGVNIRELFNSDTEITSPCWNNLSTKVAFINYKDSKAEINVVELSTAQNETIASFDNKIIDWISWTQNDKLVFNLRKVGNNSSGEIMIVNSEGGNLQKIKEYEGGIANFIYLDNSSWLGYLVAQYEDEVNDTTSGQIYIENISLKQEISLEKGSQILGWIP